ncbi:hypothetical protein B4119_4287 [Parageobacillus caldoxylosilyticus]|uniref:Uncharacterized protein n=1 Tax=Saccharococcus caldoxylosilyticus TaxID=81408 RepID=A0A150L7L5_9BACL|nr:hypothetical protein B4119_4287 [Parageobacillus caldoxylosilyticus]
MIGLLSIHVCPSGYFEEGQIMNNLPFSFSIQYTKPPIPFK